MDTEGISVREPHKPMRVLSEAEQKRLGAYLLRDTGSWQLGIVLCMCTGLRIGEICALRWSDIDMRERVLHVRHTMQRITVQNTESDAADSRCSKSRKTKVILTTPKSDCSIRTIPIPEEVFRLVAKEYAACGSIPAECFFLTGTERFVEPRCLSKRFHQAAVACEIENVTFHTLRHSFATRCIELGFDVKSLSEILGHSSVNITLGRYVHPSMEMKRANMDKVGGILETDLSSVQP